MVYNGPTESDGQWTFKLDLPPAPSFVGGNKEYPSGRNGGAEILGLSASETQGGEETQDEPPPPPLNHTPPPPVNHTPPRTSPKQPPRQPPPSNDNDTPQKSLPPRPPPGKKNPTKPPPRKVPPRKTNLTEEQWLDEAMRKIQLAINAASQKMEFQKCQEFKNSLDTLQKLKDKLVNAQPQDKEQVRQEISLIRSRYQN